MAGLRVGVESRPHRGMDEEHQKGTLRFPRPPGLAYVCVEEPSGCPSSVPPVATATADSAEVRFQGTTASFGRRAESAQRSGTRTN